MYESFFEFQQRPFAAAPRIDRYFPAAAIEAARSNLARSIERAEGAALVVGPAGTGKTLVCHLVAEQFRGRFAVAMLSNGHLDTRRELLQGILFELGLPYRRLEEGELRLSLIDYISNDQQVRDGLLLIVDEAHTLPPRLLEEIRLIANVMRNGQSRVRLVLAGNPALEEALADPQLEALSQRIAARCYLGGLDYTESQQYILAQLAAVGAHGRPVFTTAALEAIYQQTDGVPRLINQVCDHALMLAFAGGRRQIDAPGIEEAWSDLQQLPAPWSEPPRTASPAQPGRVSLIEFGHLDDDLQISVREQSSVHEQFFAPAGEMGAAAEATLLMHQIDDHLTAMTRDFVVAASPQHEPSVVCSVADPFNEAFEHEELLLDRYSALEPGTLAGRHPVESDEGQTLAALLQTFVQQSSTDAAAAVPRVNEKPPLVVSTASELTWFQSTTADTAQLATTSSVTSLDLASESGAEADSESLDAEWLEPQAVPLVRGMTHASEYDEDLMIVEEDPGSEIRVHTAPSARHVRRQEFRQLFSSLRRG
jgi:type II secretory pathway predicted ATPase ExeA